ncbi:uncharacterized protein LOC133183203 [Saccostrea echinata]|uniref:uncharacterized protein LOC133183203 n=1 Tax=Saccostrea echinata TaxID=191078 RepID=UPI002A7ED030|nr:uncharacterized protein LOC133183203 [Saccostrea echinata]
MNTFRFIAGYDNTLPMKTNDLSDLGLTVDDANPYHLKKIERELPSTARELPEPLPDYEEPVLRPSKTFNPGILKKEKAKYERRTVQHFGTTRSSFTQKSNRQAPRTPSPPEFDPPAPHRESVYYNAQDSNVQGKSLQKPRAQSPIPPPTPHIPDTQAYYNENEFKDLKGKEPLHKRSMSVPDIKHTLKVISTQIDEDLHQPAIRNIPPPKSLIPCAPPPPPSVPVPAPSVTSPVQQTPVSILKSDKRSLPSLPPTPNEEPRSCVETDTPTPAQMGLRPVKVKSKSEASSSSISSSSNLTPTPQQLGLRPVKDVQKKAYSATKEYEDAQSVKDIRQRFEKKTPPPTAQKPTGYQARKDEDEEENYHDAISVGIPRKSSFIRKLEEQIGRPVGPQGAPKVPEIKPMTEEEEQMYEELQE